MSRPLVVWAALLVPLWLVCVLCTAWEPVTHDGWGHVLWHRDHDVTLGTLADYVKFSWLGSNPRLGQIITLLLYAPGPWHSIVTPLVIVGLFVVLAAIALGRWPSVRKADDTLVVAAIAALCAACVPQFGAMLFYRPFTGNYLYGLALGLLWLVPYRFAAEGWQGRPWLAPASFVLGIAAGSCNEHTGLAFVFLGGLALFVGRRGNTIWMIAGLVGFATGYVLLLVAPGQDHRYAGLAQEAGVLGRIAERGVRGNFAVLGAVLVALAPAVPLAIAGKLSPRRESSSRVFVALGVAALGCTLTLLASPKIGPRLYFASVAFACTAIAGWALPRLDARARQVTAIASAAVLVFVASRCVLVMQAVSEPGATRLERIEAAPKGSNVVVPRLGQGVSRYFLGDDFVIDATVGKQLARDYELGSIELDPP